jgi:hypothetical protein
MWQNIRQTTTFASSMATDFERILTVARPRTGYFYVAGGRPAGHLSETVGTALKDLRRFCRPGKRVKLSYPDTAEISAGLRARCDFQINSALDNCEKVLDHPVRAHPLDHVPADQIQRALSWRDL